MMTWVATAFTIILAAPVPAGAEQSIIMVQLNDGTILLLDQRGQVRQRSSLAYPDAQLVRLAPDRKSVAYAVKTKPMKSDAKIYVQALDASEARFIMDCQHVSSLFWMPDGKSLVASGLDIQKGNMPQNFRHQCWLSWQTALQPHSSKFFDLDGEYRLAGLTPDGKQFFAIRTFDLRPVPPGQVLAPRIATYLVEPATLRLTPAIPPEVELTPIMPFPGNKQWLVRQNDPQNLLPRYGIFHVGQDGWQLLAGQERVDVSRAIFLNSGAPIIGTIGASLFQWEKVREKPTRLADLTEKIVGIDSVIVR